jgi:16S rRNA (uracil1498-N3)-methyltransferase
MSERFHINCPLTPGLLHLRGPEAHHLGTVCRARPGDTVYLFNGDGREYPARVVEVSRRDVTLDVQQAEMPRRELSFALHLGVALPRGDRSAMLVEKLTELGVTVLWPLHCERSVVKGKAVESLQRQVIEASKQCGRNVLLRVEEPIAWNKFVTLEQLPKRRLLAHPSGARKLPQQGNEAVVAAIGPEGGFSQSEVALAEQAGWQLLGLGPRILRVETAAIAVAVLLGWSSEPG